MNLHTARRYEISFLVVTKYGFDINEKMLFVHVVDQRLLVGCMVIVDCSFNITACFIV